MFSKQTDGAPINTIFKQPDSLSRTLTWIHSQNIHGYLRFLHSLIKWNQPCFKSANALKLPPCFFPVVVSHLFLMMAYA